MPTDRLDKCVVAFLRSIDREASRAEVQRWIAGGRVVVDGRPGSAASSVRVGASILVRPMPPPLSEATADPNVEIVVVYEDAYLLIVDKPAGMVVHPARGHSDGTLVNGLLARGDFAAGPSDDRDPMAHVRPGIVHRLDKGTSGLLVIAKDARTREGLKALFQAHDIAREYVAVVVGTARDQTIATLHGRHPKDRLRFTSRGVTRGKQAITHVRVLEPMNGATLVACTLETGRTHQIRVHLAEQMKTPVLGDPLYGTTPRDPWLADLAKTLGHQALHARLLGFVHPITGETLRFESALPADVARVVKLLRAR